MFFRKRFSFEKYGRGKERSKKKTKLFNIFEKEKKNPSRKNKTMLCQNVGIIWKKACSKEDTKTLENVF